LDKESVTSMWEYRILRLVAPGQTEVVSRLGGFETKENAMAEGERAAELAGRVLLDDGPRRKEILSVDASFVE